MRITRPKPSGLSASRLQRHQPITDASKIIVTNALNTAMGGTPSHDSSEDRFSCTLKCHNSAGEIYTVRFARYSITLSSYEADTIRTGLDAWADPVAIIAGVTLLRSDPTRKIHPSKR